MTSERFSAREKMKGLFHCLKPSDDDAQIHLNFLSCDSRASLSPPPSTSQPNHTTHLLGRRVESLAPAAEDVRVPDGVEVVFVVRVDGCRGGRRRERERDRRDGDDEERVGLHGVVVVLSITRECVLARKP